MLASWQCLHFHGEYRRQISDDRGPAVTRVDRCVYLSAGGTEVNAARVERIDRHRIAQHVDVTVLLWQPVG